MKCPHCSFVSSDQRDICPKCKLDLRPHKARRGLRITNPQASYDDLLAATARSSAYVTRTRQSASVAKGLKDTKTTVSTAVTSEELTDLKLEAEISKLEKITAEATSARQSSLQESPTGFSDEAEEPSSLPPIGTVSSAALSLLNETQGFAINELAALTKQVTEPKPVKSPPGLLDSFRAFIDQSNGCSSEVRDRFYEAGKALSALPLDEAEISASQFVSREKDERILALYGLVEESILDPESLKRYRAATVTSDVRHVTVDALKKKLEEVTRATDAPSFSLKAGSSLGPSREFDTHTDIETPSIVPTINQYRSQAMRTDILVLFVLTALITWICLYWTQDPLLSEINNRGFLDLERNELIFCSSLAISALSILWIAYPLTCAFFGLRTLGEALAGVRLVTALGQEVSTGRRLLRAIALPYELLGHLFIFGRRPKSRRYGMGELISRTVLIEPATGIKALRESL